MGIDIYARWEGQLPEEVGKQLEAWSSAESGDIGYLREAYHGEPYATRYLVKEAFGESGFAYIPAAILRGRLPETLRLAEVRERKIYGVKTRAEMEPILQSYRKFVELCEVMEAKTGEQVKIEASW